jgi:hypothetical protein
MSRITRVIAATGAALTLVVVGWSTAACAHAPRTALVVTKAPPAPRVEVRPVSPGPAFVWKAGYWGWNGHRHVWVAGHWAKRPSPTARWIPGHWKRQGRSWAWIPGRWHRS